MATTTETFVIRVVQMGGKETEAGFNRIGRAATETERILRFFRQALVAIAFARAATGVTDYVDRLTKMNNQLKLVTESTEQFEDAQKFLFDISRATRTSIEANTTLYARLSRAGKALGASETEVRESVEAVSLAAKISGATVTEATNAIIQFSQGMAAGSLMGEELNSVVEQTPRLAAAIGKEFGVAGAQLRNFAKANPGVVTTTRIIKALKDELPLLREEFLTTQATIGDAFQILNNSLFEYLNNSQLAASATQGFINIVVFLADNITTVVNVAVLALTFYLTNLAISVIPRLITAFNLFLTTASANPFLTILRFLPLVITLFFQFREEIMFLINAAFGPFSDALAAIGIDLGATEIAIGAVALALSAYFFPALVGLATTITTQTIPAIAKFLVQLFAMGAGGIVTGAITVIKGLATALADPRILLASAALGLVAAAVIAVTVAMQEGKTAAEGQAAAGDKVASTFDRIWGTVTKATTGVIGNTKATKDGKVQLDEFGKEMDEADIAMKKYWETMQGTTGATNELSNATKTATDSQKALNDLLARNVTQLEEIAAATREAGQGWTTYSTALATTATNATATATALTNVASAAVAAGNAVANAASRVSWISGDGSFWDIGTGGTSTIGNQNSSTADQIRSIASALGVSQSFISEEFQNINVSGDIGGGYSEPYYEELLARAQQIQAAIAAGQQFSTQDIEKFLQGYNVKGIDFDYLDFAGFNSGGQFTVPGSGGPDSRVYGMRLSPGEEVEIRNPRRRKKGWNGEESEYGGYEQRPIVLNMTVNATDAGTFANRQNKATIERSYVNIIRRAQRKGA